MAVHTVIKFSARPNDCKSTPFSFWKEQKLSNQAGKQKALQPEKLSSDPPKQIVTGRSQ